MTNNVFNPVDFFMPAEWEHHGSTWQQWSQDIVYPGYGQKLELICLKTVEALHDHEIIHLIGGSERQIEYVADRLRYHSGGAVGCVTQPRPLPQKFE